MFNYELVVVIHPDRVSEELETEVERIKGLLESNQAANIDIQDWGKRDLPHLAKKQKRGHYICFVFQTENNQLIEELTAVLRISDNVLKFQAHRVQDKLRKFQGNPLLLKKNTSQQRATEEGKPSA